MGKQNVQAKEVYCENHGLVSRKGQYLCDCFGHSLAASGPSFIAHKQKDHVVSHSEW